MAGLRWIDLDGALYGPFVRIGHWWAAEKARKPMRQRPIVGMMRIDLDGTLHNPPVRIGR
eukprot:3579977-Pyramimonas_sp.AAC.1